MTPFDTCAAFVPCGAILALVIPAAVICVLGVCEWLFDRPPFEHKSVEDMSDAEWFQELDDHEEMP